jgi:hypothetical protein
MLIIINLKVVNADWKEVWYHAVKRNRPITYFTSVLIPLEKRIRIPLKFTRRIRGVRWGQAKERNFNFQVLGRIGLREKIKIWHCLASLASPLEKQRWKKEKSTIFWIVTVS